MESEDENGGEAGQEYWRSSHERLWKSGLACGEGGISGLAGKQGTCLSLIYVLPCSAKDLKQLIHILKYIMEQTPPPPNRAPGGCTEVNKRRKWPAKKGQRS